MRYALALLLLLSLPLTVRAAPTQPADAVALAYKDIKALPPDEQIYARYLWLQDDDPKNRWQTYLAVAGHVNSLSRSRRIVPPVLLLSDGGARHWPEIADADWPKATLIRLNIFDYRWDPATFDKLGELDPFFHVIQKGDPYPAGKLGNGKEYPAGHYKIVALAPWLIEPLGLPEGAAKVAAAKAYFDAVVGLSTLAGYAQCPILEARNFVWQTAIDFDRKAGYYAFLGNLKKKADFDKLVGFNEVDSLNFARPLLEVVTDSGVSVQPRRVEVYEKIGGRYFLTKDQVNQRALAERNPIVTKGRDALKFDATEIFATLPNGLWAFFLADAQGNAQQSAPDGVGFYKHTRSNDGKIHVGPVTCLGCHDKVAGNAGLQPFQPYFRSLYARPGPAALAALSKKKLQPFEEEYLTPIDVEADQKRYVSSLFQCNGQLPHEFARTLNAVFRQYDRHVDLERAAFDLGVEEKVFVEALNRQLGTFGVLDDANANWLLAPERRSRIGVDQWAEAYNLAQLAMRGLPQWPANLKQRYPVKK